MSHTTHYKLSLFGALISSIAFTALSVFAIAPGATLDPVVDYPGICGGGPTDPLCAIDPLGPIVVKNTNSLFSVGIDAGFQSYADNSIFLGYQAGYSTVHPQYLIDWGHNNRSNFFGYRSGYNAFYANNSNFFGYRAGYFAQSAAGSNFFGLSAGDTATGANGSNFFGVFTGMGAEYASRSNFFGYEAGRFAEFAESSFFVGSLAGAVKSIFIDEDEDHYVDIGSRRASYSIFIGDYTNFSGVDLDNSELNEGDNCRDVDLEPYDPDYVSLGNTGYCYSILLGPYASTGSHSNSIAIGAYALNDKSNQFVIGSVERPINEIVVVQTGGTGCIIDQDGLGCSSDENLKTNISPISSTLDTLLNINPVKYNWNTDPNGSQQIGLLAQNLQQYFPELVKEGRNGYLQVNYAGMTPILTKAIQELDLKINILEQQTTSSGGFSLATLKSVIKDILSDVGNGIQNIFAKRVTTDELCVEDVCVNRDQFLRMVENSNQQFGNNNVAQETEEIVPEDDPIQDKNTELENEENLEADDIEDVSEEETEETQEDEIGDSIQQESLDEEVDITGQE
jgi:hypothetical protein